MCKKRPNDRVSARVLSLVMALVLAVGATLSLSSAPTRAASLSDLQKQQKALQQEETALRSKLSAYKNDMAKQQEYADSLAAKIANSQAQIDLLQEQIDLLNADLAEKDSVIAEKLAAIDAKENEIDAKFTLLGERLRVIAQSGNLSALQMLLDMDNYIDYLLKSNIAERIADNDQQMIDELNAEVEKLNGERAALEADKAALVEDRQAVEAIKAEADAKKTELDALYAESNAVLKKLQSDVADVNADLQKKQKEEAALDAQIKKLLSASKSSGKYTDGTMCWPVPAVHNISSGFGRRWGTTHRGIDIANGRVPVYGQNVVAAADGKVIYANKSGWGGGYGLFIMVDHGLDSRGRQIVTLYAHLSAVLVNVGDTVRGGTSVIGRAGSSGDVTGPHLHFEVRVNGTAVDPLANGYLKS